jgi:hypothetical protein
VARAVALWPMATSDASLLIEQSLPLSGVLGHRRRAAEADARRLWAASESVAQDVLGSRS